MDGKKGLRKSLKWFLENQATKQIIRLNIGDTKILRDKNSYNSSHCIIDILRDKHIRIHEIVSFLNFAALLQ